MVRRIKWIVGLAVILIAVGILVLKLRGSGDFYITPSELEANPAAEEIVRVGGRVEESNILESSGDFGGMNVSFKLSDGKARLAVVYEGDIPTTFRDGQEAVAEGSLNEEGVLVAQRILIKCPSNYLPEKAVGTLLKDTKLERLLYR